MEVITIIVKQNAVIIKAQADQKVLIEKILNQEITCNSERKTFPLKSLEDLNKLDSMIREDNREIYDNTQTKTVDNALLDLLNKWNLEHLYKHLYAHRITTNVLKVLKPDHIKTLFLGRAVGDQALFEVKLESWKEDCDDIVIILPKQNVCENRQHCSVLNVLKSTKNGKSILEYYEKNKILHEEQRHLLIKTIASYVETKDLPSSISDCLEMEKQIYSIFPTEKPEYYNSGKRGKLYSKIYSLKRNSKSILQPKKAVAEECNQKYVVEAEAKIAVQNLRRSDISPEDFDFYWSKCSPYRFQQIWDCKNITEILKEWPEYTKPSGLKLFTVHTDPDKGFENTFTNNEGVANTNFVTLGDLNKFKNELKEQLQRTEKRIGNQIREQPATIKRVLIRVLEELKIAKCDSILKSTPKTKVIPPEPFSSIEQFLKYDTEIQNDEDKYCQLVYDFESQNAKDLSHYIRLNYKKFVTDEAAQHMCWKGTEKKKPVRALAITQALKAACVKKYSVEAHLNFERICILHFQHAKGRHEKKLNYRSKVKPTL